jgi:hypothetical protein
MADFGKDGKTYWCFISYQHADDRIQDREWASWLHRELERYEIPSDLVGTRNGRGDVIPERVYPIFRDEASLRVNPDLKGAICDALDASRYLVVVCSPRAVASPYVSEEILYFKRIGRSDRILSVIIDGEPGGKENECYPLPLRHPIGSDGNLDLTKPVPPLSADVRLPGGGQGFTSAEVYHRSLSGNPAITRTSAQSMKDAYALRLQLMKLKVLAGILDVPLDTLRNRDQLYRLELSRRRSAILGRWLSAVSVLGAIAVTAGAIAYWQMHEATRAKEEAIGRLLASEALALLDAKPSGTPHVELAADLALQAWMRFPTEASNKALRAALAKSNALVLEASIHQGYLESAATNRDGSRIVVFNEYGTIHLSEANSIRGDSTQGRSRKSLHGVSDGAQDTTLALHPLHDVLMTQTPEGELYEVDLKSGVRRPIRVAGIRDIRRADYTESGDKAVIETRDGDLYVVDLKTNKVQLTYRNELRDARAIAYAYDEAAGKLFVATFADERLKGYVLHEKEPLKAVLDLPMRFEPTAIAISARRSVVYFSDGGGVKRAALKSSPTEAEATVVCESEERIRHPPGEECGIAGAEVIAVGPDGGYIALGSGSDVVLFDTDRMRVARRLDLTWSEGGPDELKGITALKFSGDGRVLVSIAKQGVIAVTDVGGDQNVQKVIPSERLQYPHADRHRFGVTFNSDGSALHWTYPLGQARYRLSSSGRELFSRTDDGVLRDPIDVFFDAPDEMLAIVKDREGRRAGIVDVSQRSRWWSLEIPPGGKFCCGAFDQANRIYWYVTGDGAVAKFDLRAGAAKQVARLKGPVGRDAETSVAVSSIALAAKRNQLLFVGGSGVGGLDLETMKESWWHDARSRPVISSRGEFVLAVRDVGATPEGSPAREFVQLDVALGWRAACSPAGASNVTFARLGGNSDVRLELNPEGVLRLTNPYTCRKLKEFNLGSEPHLLVASHYSPLVAVQNKSGHNDLYWLENGERIDTIEKGRSGSSLLNAHEFDASGRFLALIGLEELRIWATPTFVFRKLCERRERYRRDDTALVEYLGRRSTEARPCLEASGRLRNADAASPR